MRTIQFLAIAASLSVAMIAGTANAQAARLTSSVSTDHNGPDICVAACPPPAVLTPPSVAQYRGCGDKLGHLNRVTAKEIESVSDGRTVHLVPLCDVVNHSLTQQQATYLSRGNVQGLIPVIARNEVLAGKLGRNGYDPNDVLGVALGSNATVLYVSHR